MADVTIQAKADLSRIIKDLQTLQKQAGAVSANLKKAGGDITLGAGARIDLAGRAFTAFDATRYSWGGDLELNSVAGNIVQAAGSVIDLSARNQRGGRMQALALGAAGGRVALDGVILGGASGEHDAGGTRVPYDGAEITLRAQTLADFAGLNQRLNQGGVTGARRFQLKRGVDKRLQQTLRP